MSTTLVRHNADEARYEIYKDGTQIGITEYRILPARNTAPPVALFHHTLIRPRDRNQGNGERLVAAALDDVRARGLKVRATCWYVDQFLVEHPAYADLRASPEV